ncbi:uncharacterized protein LOC129597520 isoform X2 [Paramacrobiotus metropolitanus]|uniref:uncharacterized protein LOC129597520 isoform X2 n=1 Tax=Paramacrobiotus metropolitanus TaxID=2943436 RepID=UPI0024458617|nr:uncharacterized protein LOC129597520 isoform X2 [Paramacrobiotus metropolitanus]
MNNSLLVYAVREYYDTATLEQHMAWMANGSQKYPVQLMDRWLMQMLYTVDWAHQHNLIWLNLSARNIFLVNDNRDVRMVDFIPSAFLPETARLTASAMTTPKGEHVFRLFPPEKWIETTDFEAIGYVILQLSLVGHPDYELLRLSVQPYSLRQRWAFLMEAVWENHGFWWMQMIEKMLGDDYAPHRQDIMKELTGKLQEMTHHDEGSVDWGSSMNVVPEGRHDAAQCKKHNLPEAAVLVSWIEQAWEFFQHGNINEFNKICNSMLKSVPADHQGALRPHHLRILEKLCRAADSEGGRFSLMALLAGILYADNAEKAAAEITFDDALLSMLGQHHRSPNAVSMLSTALAEVYCPKKKDLAQRLEQLSLLFKTALANLNNWPAFFPTLMCLFQNAVRIPVSLLNRTPIIPLLMVTMQRHIDFPCEIYQCLRFLRMIVHKNTLGAQMLVRFRVDNAVYSPVEVFLALLRKQGCLTHIHREVLLIAAHIWAMPEFFAVMISDGWYRIFGIVSGLTSDQNVVRIIEQCLADRHLILLNGKLFRVSENPFILGLPYSDDTAKPTA